MLAVGIRSFVVRAPTLFRFAEEVCAAASRGTAMIRAHFGLTTEPFSSENVALLSHQREVLETLRVHWSTD